MTRRQINVYLEELGETIRMECDFQIKIHGGKPKPKVEETHFEEKIDVELGDAAQKRYEQMLKGF